MLVDLQQDWAAGVAARLAADGFARFDRISTRAQLVTLGASLGRIVAHRDSDDDGVTTLQDRGGLAKKIGYEGFGTSALAPHTDRSGVTEPPALLLVVCGRKSSSGGECVAIDGRGVYIDLATNDPESAHALTMPRTALFGGAAGYLGSIFEHVQGGRIRVRYRNDGLVKYSPEIMRFLPVLTAAIKRHTTHFALEPGQGYVLHNHRWLHGRTAFTGDRVMYRLSLEPHPEFAIPSGFARPDMSAVVPG
ncbi:TauD/TfdA family dioxygenase [Nocardia sp. NBC_01009]|uniref:TauD/TfdA family dioxygenase n=1 Tax=Nocardia sp. NBC_01009 TaxID=2975996 RepID=UPI00386FDE98|nr:TauD/TfdA family dioxygenase [Nocardia sp. NBC_01009]